jgi:hypothetical protein
VNPIDLNDYVWGGFFVATYAADGWWKSPLVPERIISLSRHIGRVLPVTWGWEPDKNRVELRRFGIREYQYQDFHQWAVTCDADLFGYYDLDETQEMIRRFIPKDWAVLLLAAGLHRELVDEFLTYKPYPDEHPNYIVWSSPDHDERQRQFLAGHVVNDRDPLPEGGVTLGYEILSYEMGLEHSWLSSGLLEVMLEQFNIRPNSYGLIDSYAEAKQVYEWIAEDKMQGTRAEPEPYYPWLIVQYPVNRGS